jgi:hypothetical protein
MGGNQISDLAIVQASPIEGSVILFKKHSFRKTVAGLSNVDGVARPSARIIVV